MITASMNGFDGAAFGRDLIDTCRRAIEEAAKKVPIDLSRRIYARVDPDNNSQRPNLSITRRAKKRIYGHDVPLLATGLLSTPQRYKIRRQGDAYHVSPPIGRTAALEGLESQGYRIWGISDEVSAYARQVLESGLAWMEARLKGGVYRR